MRGRAPCGSRLTGAGVLLAALFWCAPGHAQQIESREAIALQNQILELRHDMQVLQSQAQQGAPQGGSSLGGGYAVRPTPLAGGGAGAGSEMVAELLARVQRLEEEVRDLRGRIDEIDNRTQQQDADLAKQIGDLNFALQQGGGRAGAMVPGPSPTLSPPPAGLGSAPAGAVPPSAPTAPVRRTPEMTLQEGHAALARHDYPAAEAAAREVLQTSRTSPRAYDAQYLLAQALAGQRNFAQSAIAYDDTYTRSKTGSHAAEALVGLAGSLASIGEKRAACETVGKLNAEFPRQNPEVRDGATLVRQRAGCH